MPYTVDFGTVSAVGLESSPVAAALAGLRANIRIAYVFYQSGLSVNVMYTVDDPGKRAVGFKLSEGMEVPAELASRFKFASQKSKLAGTIRGSYFAFKRTSTDPRAGLRGQSSPRARGRAPDVTTGPATEPAKGGVFATRRSETMLM